MTSSRAHGHFPYGTADRLVEIHAVSADGRFGIHLPKHCLRAMLDHAARDYPKETGGVLLGRYLPSMDLAVVTQVSGPPDDSTKVIAGFWRGVFGLQSLINRLWREHQYYLGEWHVHPDGPPVPSNTDLLQMRAISESLTYHCPEPLLAILGFTRQSAAARWSASFYVFPRHGSPIMLKQKQPVGRSRT